MTTGSHADPSLGIGHGMHSFSSRGVEWRGTWRARPLSAKGST